MAARAAGRQYADYRYRHWSIASVILMLGAIAAMIFFHSTSHEAGDPRPPKADPLFNFKATPSMLATRKYFYVVIALILAQVGMGVVTAHYAVEGTSFFGIPLGEILPFTVSRTIHTQFAVLWIATAWLATGLYIAPAISAANQNTNAWVSMYCFMPC
ncbi:hypothetical protein [Candidatus Accumulibacter sp. ACC012]|uniref:hypothetical protein n=1 Tax=Candidatus Accumulibacter sp. ACC012 TaxID=2823332 RepID=UPI003426D00B